MILGVGGINGESDQLTKIIAPIEVMGADLAGKRPYFRLNRSREAQR